MATSYSPKIVTSGLSVNLDAANKKSYPGSGDYWYNLGSERGYLYRGTYTPAYTTLGGATCLNFNQVGAAFSGSMFAAPYPANGTNLTIDAWVYPSSTVGGGDRGNICRGTNPNGWYFSFYKTNYKLSNYWYGKVSEGYFETSAAMNLDAWNNIVAVWDGANIYQYLNTTVTSTGTTGNTGYTCSNLEIGYEAAAGGRQFLGGIAIIRIYNISLTTSQVCQNYDATRTRFGL